MRLFTDPTAAVAEPMLARALRLAERGRATASPNPMVGCVITQDGRIVGEGYHERAGGPHAEVAALAAAGEAASGATAFVTLEPCDHHGKTSPCTSAMVAAGIAEVVIGMPDPNPHVDGGGAAALAAAGLTVRFAEDPAPFAELNEAWVKWVTTGRPWLDVKVALTLDGRPAIERGRRTLISGEGISAATTMQLRAAADAVAVGAATATVDDPLLTVREVDGTPAPRQPLRVVVCRTACPPPGSRILDASLGPVAVLVPDGGADGCDELAAAGVTCERYSRAEGFAGAMRELGRRGVTRVLLEAGPGMFTAAWEADAIDALWLLHSGGVGGMDAPSLFLGEGRERNGKLAATMRCAEAGVVGEDAVTSWVRRGPGRDAG